MLIRQNGVRTEMTARGLTKSVLVKVRKELNILARRGGQESLYDP